MDRCRWLSGWAFGDARRGQEPGYLDWLKELARRLAEQEAANQRVHVQPGSQEYTLRSESDGTGSTRIGRDRIVVRCALPTTLSAAGVRPGGSGPPAAS